MNGSRLSTCIEDLNHEVNPREGAVEKVTHPFNYDIAEAEERGRDEGGDEANGRQLGKPRPQVPTSHLFAALFFYGRQLFMAILLAWRSNSSGFRKITVPFAVLSVLAAGCLQPRTSQSHVYEMGGMPAWEVRTLHTACT